MKITSPLLLTAQPRAGWMGRAAGRTACWGAAVLDRPSTGGTASAKPTVAGLLRVSPGSLVTS
ncbi:hypothetical protein QUA82_32600 [Microcoleus sp. F8-D3]